MKIHRCAVSGRMRVLAAVVGALLAFSAAAVPARAAGVTTHWMIGETVLLKLATERPALAALLYAEYGAFRRGTVYPDAAQTWMKNEAKRLGLKDDKWPHSLDDNLSHDYTDHPAIVTRFIDVIRRDCGGIDFAKAHSPGEVSKTAMTAIQCRNALSYMFGMVNHMIADAPWHAVWIGKGKQGTLGKACPQVPNDWGSKVQPRHNFADLDIDICLASRLNGNPLALNTVIGKSRAEKQKTKAQFLCPKGQFPDIATGACYSCEKGLSHNPALPAETPGVCFRLPGEFKTAKRHEKVRLACGARAFPDLATGDCYACPASAPQFFPQYGVHDERVCQNRQTVHCDLIELPLLNQFRIVMNPLAHSKLIAEEWVGGNFETAMKTGPVELLKKAYRELGYKEINVEAADAEINNFYLAALKEPLTPLNHLFLPKKGESGFSEHAGRCSWAFTHLFDPEATGSIPDSAKEVVRFVVPMWDAIVKREPVELKRTGAFRYALDVKGRTVAHYP
jgi:hypothetical protein